jgi:hypothetical protein
MSPGTTERRVLDNVREQSGLNAPAPTEETATPAPGRFRLRPLQTLLLAAFLVVDVCVLGLLFLLVTNRIALPF